MEMLSQYWQVYPNTRWLVLLHLHPIMDRSASAHEYMFHFVLQRKYYYNYEAVAVPSKRNSNVKAPPSVWKIGSAPTFKKHCAVFPEELVRIPVLATLPPDGILLDP